MTMAIKIFLAFQGVLELKVKNWALEKLRRIRLIFDVEK